MNITIYFNNQCFCVTIKIHDITINDLLASKL